MGDWREHLAETDADLSDALRATRIIAVIGFKNDPTAAAFIIPHYMARHGYRVIPVSPSVAGQKIGDEVGRASLSQVPEPVDLVNVFRASNNIPGHVGEILALSPRPRWVWLQSGIRNNDAAEQLARAGITVIQDRCLMVEHRRLIGSDAGRLP